MATQITTSDLDTAIRDVEETKGGKQDCYDETIHWQINFCTLVQKFGRIVLKRKTAERSGSVVYVCVASKEDASAEECIRWIMQTFDAQVSHGNDIDFLVK